MTKANEAKRFSNESVALDVSLSSVVALDFTNPRATSVAGMKSKIITSANTNVINEEISSHSSCDSRGSIIVGMPSLESVTTLSETCHNNTIDDGVFQYDQDLHLAREGNIESYDENDDYNLLDDSLADLPVAKRVHTAFSVGGGVILRQLGFQSREFISTTQAALRKKCSTSSTFDDSIYFPSPCTLSGKHLGAQLPSVLAPTPVSDAIAAVTSHNHSHQHSRTHVQNHIPYQHSSAHHSVLSSISSGQNSIHDQIPATHGVASGATRDMGTGTGLSSTSTTGLGMTTNTSSSGSSSLLDRISHISHGSHPSYPPLRLSRRNSVPLNMHSDSVENKLAGTPSGVGICKRTIHNLIHAM